MDKRVKIAGISVLLSAIAIAGVFKIINNNSDESTNIVSEQAENIVLEVEQKPLYGIAKENLVISNDIIKNGEVLSEILLKYGKGAAVAHQLEQQSKAVFSTRNFRAGNKYTTFVDTTSSESTLSHLVYHQNVKDYVVYSFHDNDSISIEAGSREVTIKREMKSGVIKSSLWNAMIEQGMPAGLTMELSDIYAWSVNFFGLQEGDHFTIIYDNEYIDSTSVGTGMIWGAIFNHHGKDFHAIPFEQSGKVSYWDEEGNSLRKNFLKAPLKFSRISSKFTYSRLHPILKIRRAHTGVDYAAPYGTPVYAIADGVITYKSYTRGGGNTLKIKHGGNMKSGYLHLKGYPKGIVKGKHVNQGDLIGYVGSTGLSTGPHLDFRVWRGGVPIDPLKVPSEPAEPILESSKDNFNYIKDRVLGELTMGIDSTMFVTNINDTVPNIKLALIDENRE